MKPKRKLIIGLSGTMHSGKTTAATGLLNAFAPRAIIVSLAQPIKEAIQSITGHMVTHDNKETLRPLLQSYGEVMKALHGERHWIDRAEARWQLLKYNHDVMICDDIRFPAKQTGSDRSVGSL
jgi:BioD-like phosphotransacetylase family protein